MATAPHVGPPAATVAAVSPGSVTAPLHVEGSPVRHRSSIEKYFETFLWGSRYVVLVAVVASLAIAFGSIYVATIDTISHLRKLGDYASPALTAAKHDELRAATVTHVVEAIDGYLLGIVMLIFAFGLYELFISRINLAEKDEKASRILLIHSLDDLKHRLAQVILLILIVKFFESTLGYDFNNSLELLYLAIGILMISGALYLAHKKDHPESSLHKGGLLE